MAKKFSYEVVREPHISEKSNILGGLNKYVFRISAAANKPEIKKAVEGKYRVKVNVYQRYSGYQKAPAMIRIISFKNFQQTGQVLSIENVIVDDQYGVVEIGEVKW